MASVPFTRKDKIPCRPYQQGRCTRGKNCPFAHADRREQARNSPLAAILKLVFEKQCDRLLPDEGRMLNLSEFSKCPDLEKITNSVDFDSMAFCEAIVTVVRGMPVTVHYVQLDGNNIKSLFHFCKAMVRADLNTSIRAFSAANNRINTFEFLQHLKPFCNLMEIQLMGNPIADNADYRTSIRKNLPTLEGLDGAGINRPPLNLPWPQPTGQSDESVSLLQLVEARLFRVLEEGGTIDSLSALYGDDAVFSLTCADSAAVKPPAVSSDVQRRNVILRDFVSMRHAQTDRNNDLKTSRNVRTARGRTDVCSALRSAVYPRSMIVNHNLSSDSHAVPISAGVKSNVIMFSFHGTIRWQHKELGDAHAAGVTRNFDRSLTVCTTEDGGFFITNDALTLREDTGPPLWFANTESRIVSWSEKFSIPPPVMQAVFNASSTDVDVAAAASDVQQLGPGPMDECLAATEGRPEDAIAVARVCLRTSAPPAAAVDALALGGGDLDTACGALMAAAGSAM